MPLGVSEYRSPEEEAALEALRDDAPPQPDEADATPSGDAPAAEPTASAPSTEEAKPAEPTQPAAEAPAAPTTDEKPKGNLKAALRAARTAEQRAKEEAATLRQQLEELKAKVPAEPEDVSDADLQELEADLPVVARAIKKVLKAQAAAPAPAPQTPADPTFEPPVLPPAVQEVVDEIPDLLEWQHDPDQTNFEMAKAEDRKLLVHPKWKDKPQAERLAEVARRVKAELGAPSTETPPVDPKAALKRLAEIERDPPNSISDIGGGGGKPTTGSSLAQFMSMSREDALAELERGG